MRFTITTKYSGPTNTRGSRLIASGFGKRISVPYDYALNSFENHKMAAQALLKRESINGQLKPIQDELKTGYRFIVEIEHLVHPNGHYCLDCATEKDWADSVKFKRGEK